MPGPVVSVQPRVFHPRTVDDDFYGPGGPNPPGPPTPIDPNARVPTAIEMAWMSMGGPSDADREAMAAGVSEQVLITAHGFAHGSVRWADAPVDAEQVAAIDQTLASLGSRRSQLSFVREGMRAVSALPGFGMFASLGQHLDGAIQRVESATREFRELRDDVVGVAP